jgi:hypothetical protein
VHLLLHRVEALVETTNCSSLDLLAQHLLVRIRQAAAPTTTMALANHLDLDPELVEALLARLLANGRIETTGDRSFQAVGNGAGAAAFPYQRERRVFYFVDARPPFFLALPSDATWPVHAPSAWRFDLASLRACLERPDAWKQGHRFPTEVRQLVWPLASDDPDHWRAVPLDRAEQTLLLLVETEEGHLQGLRVHPENWALSADVVLDVPPSSELVGLLKGEARQEDWRQAWQGWCQQRGVTAAESDGCRLEPGGGRLLIRGSQRLLDRLRQSRSDILRGDTWLFAGAGRVRQAAVVDLVT